MPHDELVFFVDRCLGSVVVADALRAVGARVELHDDHFEEDATDTSILKVVGAQHWIFLSKDKTIRRRPAETEALMEAGVAAFIITAGNAKGEALGAALVKALPRMRSICATHTRPLIASVTLGGSVTVLHGQRRGAVRRK